jgi:hypothetical protein
MRPLLVVAIFFLCYFLVVYAFYLRRKAKEREKKRQESLDSFDTLIETFDLIDLDPALINIIPEGEGPFGLCKQNPIPVNGEIGEVYYLSRLRTENNTKVQYKRRGSTRSWNIPRPIDIYQISVEGKKICDLYLCPYYTTNSELAPEGFKFN